VYSEQLRFLSKLVNERQTANSLSVELNEIEMMSIVSPKKLLSFYLIIIFLKHTQALITWLQQPAFLQVACSSSFYCYDAEDSPSIGEATRRKMKLSFKNDLKTCLVILVDNVHQIVCKRQRIRPFFKLLDEPRVALYVYAHNDGTTRTEQ